MNSIKMEQNSCIGNPNTKVEDPLVLTFRWLPWNIKATINRQRKTIPEDFQIVVLGDYLS